MINPISEHAKQAADKEIQQFLVDSAIYHQHKGQHVQRAIDAATADLRTVATELAKASRLARDCRMLADGYRAELRHLSTDDEPTPEQMADCNKAVLREGNADTALEGALAKLDNLLKGSGLL